jgi:hypothetical protein
VSQLFQISNLLVMPFWVLMIALPNWSWSRRIMASSLFVIPIAMLYSSLVIPNFAALLPLLANPQLDLIAGLLSTPSGATTAWIHFLAFDLWTGRWVYSDSQQLGIPTWLTSLCLICVFMMGPFGLLLYIVVRRWRHGSFGL